MTRLADVCRYVRSKNAGPFWITVDLFFPNADSFSRHAGDAALSPAVLADALGVFPDGMKIIPVPSLHVVKISYPRPNPQGWRGERDMHSGQQYVALLDLELADGEPVR